MALICEVYAIINNMIIGMVDLGEFGDYDVYENVLLEMFWESRKLNNSPNVAQAVGII